MEKEKELEMEKICIQNFCYSPSYIFDLKENFESVFEIISHYVEISGGLGEKQRKKIIKLSFEANKIKIKISKLNLLSDQLVNQVRENYLIKKEIKKDMNKINETQKLIKEIEDDFAALLESLKEYIEEVERNSNGLVV